jgi:hypothetical protein
MPGSGVSPGWFALRHRVPVLDSSRPLSADLLLHFQDQARAVLAVVATEAAQDLKKRCYCFFGRQSALYCGPHAVEG